MQSIVVVNVASRCSKSGSSEASVMYVPFVVDGTRIAIVFGLRTPPTSFSPRPSSSSSNPSSSPCPPLSSPPPPSPPGAHTPLSSTTVAAAAVAATCFAVAIVSPPPAASALSAAISPTPRPPTRAAYNAYGKARSSPLRGGGPFAHWSGSATLSVQLDSTSAPMPREKRWAHSLREQFAIASRTIRKQKTYMAYTYVQ